MCVGGGWGFLRQENDATLCIGDGQKEAAFRSVGKGNLSAKKKDQVDRVEEDGWGGAGR